MATVFIEAGTSATFGLEMFNSTFISNGALASSASNPNGQARSLKCTANSGGTGRAAIVKLLPTGAISNSAGRLSFGIFIDHFADGYTDGTVPDYIATFTNNSGNVCWQYSLDNNGNLRILDKNSVSQATGTTTLLVNTFYRVTLTWNITDNTHNTFKIFLSPAGGGAGTIEATATNITTDTTVNQSFIGLGSWNSTTNAANLYITDVYLDNSNTSTDVGDIHVTAKRPFANGTTNGFSTTGSGSGYGTGNAAFVNERALSTTNFVSAVGAGTAVTEEYNIEGASTGDVSLATATLVDYVGWLYAKSLAGETGQLILNNATSNISLTSSNTMFRKAAGSTTYPTGTGTDIGIITDTSLTTVSLFEAGIIFAYIPGAAGGATGPWRALMGVGM